MNEYTVIDTIQVTRIIKSENDIEESCVNENGQNVIDELIKFDDAIVLNHQVFIRNGEDNLKEGEE